MHFEWAESYWICEAAETIQRYAQQFALLLLFCVANTLAGDIDVGQVAMKHEDIVHFYPFWAALKNL